MMRTVDVDPRPPWLAADFAVRVPAEANGLQSLLEERWRTPRPPLSNVLPFHYHLVPAPVRGWIAGRLLGRAAAYPRRPWDPSVDALRWSAGLRPWWPEGRRFAVVLTHDVDSAAGLARLDAVLDVERRRGVRSTTFVCSHRYPLDVRHLEGLQGEGFEIASHGYDHDNRLAFMLHGEREARLDAIAARLRAVGPRGFRSSSLTRTPQLFRSLQGRFAYDSSVPDVDLEGEGGCGTVAPFRIGPLVEVPVTLPMDCTLIYQGLGPADAFARWREKLGLIREVGGVATAVLHAEPHLGGREDMLRGYDAFLADLPADAWVAPAAEIARHAAATFLSAAPPPRSTP